ncbi:methyltransferase [Marinimicrobium sp. ABcell2]|uniref:methyltransferase n=1 Tax=Marinimicrobium sp. ABcell2 TaxID=3069751 RepID=UPI0027B13F6B|nr:methyltransferase [Marinimicrobium sp. ABcell2]MDQ2076428.1 methyltransferase [Marinimicrobium sp. ABcell2]
MSLKNDTRAPIRRRKAGPGAAVEARSKAQKIAFGPVIFYAAVVMRDTGLLALLARSFPAGLTVEELCRQSGLSHYAVSVLTDLAVDADIVRYRDDHLVLEDLGYFLMNDTMTRVNMDFVRDICYQALPFLQESLQQGHPAGLHTLGDWDNVYQGLSSLKEPARSSWFRFDHYYSDQVFDTLLPIVFRRPVRRLLDVGANTGRWSLKCLDYDPDVELVMVDLPGQLALAKENVEEHGSIDRVSFCAMDVLAEDARIPEGCDTIWMSQFLDCFAPHEIESILTRAAQTMSSEARLYILEPFSDHQQFTAASLSLNATSLYFSCVANGNSRMYSYREFAPLISTAGLEIETEHHLSFGHSLLICRVTPQTQRTLQR